MKKKDLFYKISSLPAMVILILLFLIPLTGTLSKAFIVEGHFSFQQIIACLLDSYNLRVMAFTVKQAFLSTLLSLIIGFPGAYLLAKFNFRGKKAFRSLCTIPFILPSILVVLGFVIFYGNNGFLNNLLMSIFHLSNPPLKILYSFTAVLLAHSFYNFPIIINFVSNQWELLSDHPEKAAATLGSKPIKTFFKITLPRLMPSIISSCSLIFLYCFTSFAIILVLGGGPKFTTIEVEIYNLAKRRMDIGGAASLSIFSLIVSMLLLIIYLHFQKKATNQEVLLRPSNIKKTTSSKLKKILIIFYIVLLLFFILAPIISIFARSFITASSRADQIKSFTFNSYKEIFLPNQSVRIISSSTQAIINSLILAFVSSITSTILALGLCIGIKHKSSFFTELLVMLPMAVSSVIIGLGYLIIGRYFNSNFFFFLIVLAHTVIILPFAIKSLLPIYRSIPSSLTNASQLFGYSPFRTFFNVELPLLKNAIITSLSFSFSLSLGEMNATLILSNSKFVTIPTLIYRMINSYYFQGACALGSLFIIICFILFYFSQAIGRTNLAK